MRNLKKHSRGWRLWRLIAVFVACGYAISTVIAYDGNPNGSTSWSSISQITTDSPSLHAQIQSNVAFGVKKVWNNLVSFMQDGVSTGGKTITKTSSTNLNLGGINAQDTTQVRINFPESESTLLPVFEDIQNDPQKQNIELLASIGLFQGNGNGKFNPLNHVRCSDFVRVIVDLYRYKLGYNLESDDGLTNKKLLDLKEPNTSLGKKLNTAKELGLLEGVNFLVRDQTITPLQVKKIINNTLALHLNFGRGEALDMIDTSKSVVTKSEMAKYLVEIFQLSFPQNDDVFSDIANHKYHTAITRLAQLGVVAGRNGKFYPDNHVRHADGIIMIANSMIVKQQSALVINDFYHLNTINDVTYFATYAPHLEYLLEHEIGTSLLHTTQSGSNFLPDAVLTKGEAYTLVAEAAGIKILNLGAGTTTEPITRGELANLLVEAFDFSDNNQYYKGITATDNQPSEENKSLLVSIIKDVVDKL